MTRVRWPFALAFLLTCCVVELSWEAQTTVTPVLPITKDPAVQRNFQNAFQQINTKPTISTGSGAPGNAPQKIGDEYIDTSAGKIYIATATATSGSWVKIN